MQTKCVFSDCELQFDLDSLDEPGRAVVAFCPGCSRTQSFKPLSVLQALAKHGGKRSPGPISEPLLFLAIVEDVRSLHNVGSIFRTADGAGINKLILCGITGVPPRKEISKTSLGAEDSLSWEYFISATEVIPQLKAEGFLIVGLERNATSLPLSFRSLSGQIQKPLCLVVGNEVTGISAESLEMCDVVMHLPMRGIKESLNVSVAFGIAAYLIADCLFQN